MELSKVNLSKLNEEWRLDAEYYRPRNLEAEKKITSKPFILAERLFDFVSGPFGSTVKTESYTKNIDYRYIRGKDIAQFFIDDSDPVFLIEGLFNKLPQYHLKRGDILVTVVGMNFGLAANVYEEEENSIFSCKSSLIRNPEINPYYFVAYLSCKYGYRLLRRCRRGAAQPGINLSDLKSIPVPEICTDLQNLIEKKVFKARQIYLKSKELYVEATNQFLKEIGLSEWKPFHKLTFTKKISDVISAKRVDAEYFQPKFSSMFDNLISQVKLVPLRNLVTITKGIEVGGKNYSDAGIPFWRVSNLTKKGLEFKNGVFIKNDLYNSLRFSFEPIKGEILLSKDATPGIAFYLNHQVEGIISSGILRLRLIDGIPAHYLELVLNSIVVQLQIEQDAGGSVIKHWKPAEVETTLIPRINTDKEIQINALVKKSHNELRTYNKLIENVKLAVELAVDKDENAAIDFLNDVNDI